MEFDVVKFHEEETDLGALDMYVVSKVANPSVKYGIFYERVVIKTTKGPVEIVLYKINKEYPLILDRVKKFFKIFRTRYYYTQIEGTRYLARLPFKEISLDEYIKLFTSSDISHKNKITNIGLRASFINEIQRLIAFNWVMCIPTVNNTESKIYVRALNPTHNIDRNTIVYPYTCNERDFARDVSSCDISDKTLNRWFDGSRELFYAHVRKIVKGIDIVKFKSEFEKIILMTNSLLVPWVNIVYDRMVSIQYLEVEDDE